MNSWRVKDFLFLSDMVVAVELHYIVYHKTDSNAESGAKNAKLIRALTNEKTSC